KGMDTKDQETAIAYQNKDIVSKLFGDRMKGKPLSLFGLGTDLKVVDVKPTNLPIVQARELRMDNLFELEDGSVAILDYESEYKKSNFTKYGRYIMDVADRYLKEGKEQDIHMMVLYTADIERAETSFSRTACSIQTEASYLVKAPSEEWLKDVKAGIASQSITDEMMMHLVLLPLTYKGEERKQEAIKECVHLARRIPDKGQETFVLAGILTFTDKVINEKTRQYIKEVLGMTQVGKMLMDEADTKRAKRTARNMLKRGDSLEEIAEVLELPVETIQSWNLEACTVV
ncbi:MAG: hypothetical protein HFG58_15945, partial [Lachnospiraceae bacterium]|nr:hypothetical protein [Lachnospiraceae bacterium]